MKWIAGILMMGMLLSCANLDKMAEKGAYEEVLQKAKKRLAGKKKKEKDVKAVEHAFNRLQKQYMQDISRMQQRGSLEDWKNIYNRTERLARIEQDIESLLPLIADNGYRADIQFTRHDVLQRNALDRIHGLTIQEANELLDMAQNGNKGAARDAFNLVHDLERYRLMDDEAGRLLDRAHRLGRTYTLVTVENTSNYIIPRGAMNTLHTFYAGIEDTWRIYHHVPESGLDYDRRLHLRLVNMEVSPEQLREEVHNYEKDVLVTDWARDSDGELLLDSLGERIEVSISQTVRGRVIEIGQFKEANIQVDMELREFDGGQLIHQETFSAASQFDNLACRVSGDDRAIDERWIEVGEPIPFPTNESMVVLAIGEMNDILYDYLSDLDRRLVHR